MTSSRFVAIAFCCLSTLSFNIDVEGVSRDTVIQADASNNLHLNATGKILVNGNDLLATMQLINDLKTEAALLRQRLADHVESETPTSSPFRSPTLAPTLQGSTHSPTLSAPTHSPSIDTALWITYNGTNFSHIGAELTLTGGIRAVETLTVFGRGTVTITAAGGIAGDGLWGDNNDPGAPGGRITIEHEFNYDNVTTLYAFVAEVGNSYSGSAGAGGASSDLRSIYTGSLSDVEGPQFMSDFTSPSSLQSRLIVAGGGGGAHGGTQWGYWGDVDSPGAGGPNRTYTNSIDSHDAGHVNTGATITGPGLDGGDNTNILYTGNGKFGMGGQGWGGIMNGRYVGNNENHKYSGMTWPNGGSGSGWATGGGGGGWYGGACNWPNGGGGSNYNTVGTVVVNEGAVNAGAGFITITIGTK